MASTERTRRSHAVANDGALRTAFIDEVAERGWESTTLASIVERAGLTYGAAYNRYAHLNEWALDAWRADLGPAFDHLMADMADAVHARDAEALDSWLTAATTPSPRLRAIVELILAARVSERITPIFAHAQRSMSATIGRPSPAAAARATAVAMLVGFVLLSDRPWRTKCDLRTALSKWAQALTQPGPTATLPTSRAAYLERINLADETDPALSRLLRTFLAEVGTVGFTRTTMSRVCRLAEVSPGFVYGRFDGKVALLQEAAQQMLGHGFAETARWQTEQFRIHGRVIGEALTWREYLRVAPSESRVVLLEIARLACHDKVVRRTQLAQEKLAMAGVAPNDAISRGALHVEMALGIGLPALAELHPQAHRLPYVTLIAPAVERGLFVS